MAAAAICLQDRLELYKYSEAECSAAIRGEKVPFALGLSVTRCCVIRGIRYHAGFATELHGVPGHPQFTRALNARSIMSNAIPDMRAPEEFPYCIWHPDLAAENTYRQLAHRYPQMRYHVGRACAVAGYLDLYRELGLLPDVSIAEEARDNQENSTAILDEIMAQPTRYAVMDDYTRSVNLINPRAGACLNCNTAVRSLLEFKQKHLEPLGGSTWDGYEEPGHDESRYFNICEDWGIDDYDSSEVQDDSNVLPLLYSPLPTDLPTVDKDLLILIAAYSGNIDRYARLRRPMMIRGECSCIVRGIYHDTMFAKWWSLQSDLADSDAVRRAINARFIMNNDLSRITDETDEEDLPYQIWYPYWAHYATYEELARRRPSMKPQAARACIVADYKESYNRIGATPDYFLVKEAQASPNPYYLEDLQRRAKEMHIDVETVPSHDRWKRYVTRQNPPRYRATMIPTIDERRWVNFLEDSWYDSQYDGLGADISPIELFISVPDLMKPTEEFPDVDLKVMYLEACRPDEYPDRGRLTGGRSARRGRGRGRGSSS